MFLSDTHSVFSFSHLMNAELLSTGAHVHLSLNFVVNSLSISDGAFVFPVRAQGSNKFLVIDEPILIPIEYIRHGAHFQFARREF